MKGWGDFVSANEMGERSFVRGDGFFNKQRVIRGVWEVQTKNLRPTQETRGRGGLWERGFTDGLFYVRVR